MSVSVAQNPVRILRVIARLNVGGPAKHVVWLTAGLQDGGYQSLLVAGTVPYGEEDMSYFAANSGVKPFYIPEMSREISFKDVLTIYKLFRLFLRERPDIVHTHTAKAGTVGRIAGFFYRWLTPGVLIGRPRKCRFVHTYHGHIFHSYYGNAKTRLFIAIERLLAALITDRIVVISQQQAAEICNRFRVGTPDQFSIIPLGLDLNVFTESSINRDAFRNELGIEERTILVGIVGRLTEIKNHQLFLDSIAHFQKLQAESKDTTDVRFVIIGDGLLRERLEAKAHSLGLDQQVIFTGARRDPQNFYPGLDVVALTSLNEGTPLTLIEAMANSLPTVATGVGGVVDLLGDVSEMGEHQICQRGIRVPSGDAESIARGIKRLVNDPSLRRELGRRGQDFVQRNYRKARLLDDIKSLYKDLMSSASKAAERSSINGGLAEFDRSHR